MSKGNFTSLGTGNLSPLGVPTGISVIGPIPLAVALLHVASDMRATLIRDRRKAAGLTIEEAARKAGTSISTWNNLENTLHPSFRPRTLRQALAALSIPEEITVPDTTEATLAQ